MTEPSKSYAEDLTKGPQGSVVGAALWCKNLPPSPLRTPLLLQPGPPDVVIARMSGASCLALPGGDMVSAKGGRRR